jgi:TonB family protein
VAHAVSAFYQCSDRMPPAAALLAALLHAATAAALVWMSPLHRHDLAEDAIEVTIEQPKPPEPPREAVQQPVPPPPTRAPPPAPVPSPPAAETTPPPPPPAAATPKAEPKPTEQAAASKEPLGISPPAPPAPEPPQQQEPKPQPPQEEAAAAPPPETPEPAPEPPLEKVVPPVEAPQAPLTMRDFVKIPPPPSVPHPTPQPQPAPQRSPQPLQHSPLSTAPTPAPQASANPSVSTFINPAGEAARTRAKDAYLWQVVRKFSQYLPNLREKNEGGTVVLRFVIARDGRLVEASIAKSSGVVALDRGMLESLRAASPYPPLPPELPGNQVVFVQPIAAKQ